MSFTTIFFFFFVCFSCPSRSSMFALCGNRDKAEPPVVFVPQSRFCSFLVPRWFNQLPSARFPPNLPCLLIMCSKHLILLNTRPLPFVPFYLFRWLFLALILGSLFLRIYDISEVAFFCSLFAFGLHATIMCRTYIWTR